MTESPLRISLLCQDDVTPNFVSDTSGRAPRYKQLEQTRINILEDNKLLLCLRHQAQVFKVLKSLACYIIV